MNKEFDKLLKGIANKELADVCNSSDLSELLQMYRVWIRKEIMIFFRTLVVTFIVSIVLNVLTRRLNERVKTSSLKKFIVRAPKDFVFLGVVDMIMVIGIYVYGLYSDEKFSAVMYGCLIFLAAPGLLLMFAPIKGIWDIIVDNDDITVMKAFIYKRGWKFSEIEYCKITRGGIKVYVKGRRRKAFFVDAMVEESGNFRKRVEKEGIPIYFPKEKLSHE